MKEKNINLKLNKMLKIADKHSCETVKEQLDSLQAENREDASGLRAAISKAAGKENSKPYNKPDTTNSGSGR